MSFQDLPGGHRLFVADVERDDLVALLDRPVAAVLTDPPWNRGMATMMRGWAGRDGRADFDRLLDNFARACASILAPDRYACVEMNFQAVDAMVSALRRHGFDAVVRPCSTVMEDGRTGKGALLIVASQAADVQAVVVDPSWAWLDLWRGLCVQVAQAGEVVFDPFMGYGAVLRAAHATGRVAYGSDLNEKRLGVAAKRLAKDLVTPNPG